MAINIMLLAVSEIDSPELSLSIFYLCIIGAILSLFSTVTYFLKHGTEMNQIGTSTDLEFRKITHHRPQAGYTYTHSLRRQIGATITKNEITAAMMASP
jgi:hypothetical protein